MNEGASPLFPGINAHRIHKDDLISNMNPTKTDIDVDTLGAPSCPLRGGNNETT